MTRETRYRILMCIRLMISRTIIALTSIALKLTMLRTGIFNRLHKTILGEILTYRKELTLG